MLHMIVEIVGSDPNLGIRFALGHPPTNVQFGGPAGFGCETQGRVVPWGPAEIHAALACAPLPLLGFGLVRRSRSIRKLECA